MDTINRIILLMGIRVDRNNDAAWDEHMDSILILAQWIQERWGSMTLEEIELAYNLAAAGELPMGDEKVIPLLAPIYFGKILAAFRAYKVANVEAMNVFRTQAQLPQPEEKEPTEEEIEAIMQQTLERALHQVEHGGEFADPGNALYDWLDSRSEILFTPAEKWEFMEKAAAQEKLELAAKAAENTRHPDDRKRINNLIAELKTSIPQEFKDRVKVRAKYLALNEYLKQQTKKDK